MNAKTLKEFKKRAGEFYKLYESLIALWNGDLKHGDSAIYPVTVLVGVILHNIAFDASDCSGYSHEQAVKQVRKNIKTLENINEYENKMYMTHYPWTEMDTLFSGLEMSEDYESDESIPDCVLSSFESNQEIAE